MTLDRDGWVAAAREIVERLVPVLARFGVAVDGALTVAADSHPCPGYRHDTRQILFCPPVVASAVDRLRWSWFARIMGAHDVAEAAAFYEVALPLVVAHELAHHVRFARGLASDSAFVEEQVCDRIACALLDEVPAYRAGLAEVGPWCARLRARLAPSYGEAATRGFVPGLGEALHALGALSAEELARLEALGASAGVEVDALAALAAGDGAADAAAALRDDAGARVDSRYTDDASEYWFLSYTWVASYLARRRRPDLVEVLREHVLVRSGSAARAGELALVSEIVADAGVGALVALLGAARHVPAADAARLLATAAAAWPAADGPTDEVAAVIAAWSRLPVQPALRLCGVAGVPAPDGLLAAARDGDDAARLEWLAATAAPPPDELVAALACPSRTAALLDAWRAWRRPRAALPAAPLAALLRAPPPRLRGALAALATPAERAAALPHRGSPAWGAAAEALRDHRDAVAAAARAADAIPALRLRAAALLADVGGDAAARDAVAAALLDRAVAQVALAAQFAAAPSPVAPLAAAQLRIDARRLALEVVRAVAPAAHAEAVHRLAVLAELPGPLDPTRIDVLVAAVASPVDDVVRAVLEARVAPARAGAAPLVAATVVGRSPLHAAALVPPSSLEEAMSSTIDRTLQLAAVPLFVHLEPARLWQLAELAVEVAYADGDEVVREGEPGARLYVVVAGAVRVEKRGASGAVTALAELGAGEAFGEMALLDGAPRSATVRAVGACRLLTLEGDALRRIGRDHPEVYEALLVALGERLRATSELAAG